MTAVDGPIRPTPAARLAFASLWRTLSRAWSVGTLVVELPNGRREACVGLSAGPSAHLRIASLRMLRRVLLSWDMGLADAYLAGEWTSPDLASLLFLLERNFGARRTARRLVLPFVERIRHFLRRNTKAGSRRNIAAHYDLGNAFYARWLDSSMTYSSARFSSGSATLEEAQSLKMHRVADVLEAGRGHRVLEIGCGWGGLAQHLAKRGCSVKGLTLSKEQLEFARQRAAEAGLNDRCAFEPTDYRDVSGAYDRIVSVEMIEAVGEAYWPRYFRAVRDRLKPGGIAVIQAITIDDRRFHSYRDNPDFIQRYIFPGGMLPSPAILAREIAAAGLELVHREFFAASYARTLAEWAKRFANAWPEIEILGFDLRFKRMWEYYLAYCQAGFETGTLDVGLYKIVRP